MQKKLLFITSRLLWPIDGGRKMSLNYYCKGLHEQFGYDIYLYCFLENGQHYDEQYPDYIKNVYIADEVQTSEKINNIIKYTLGPKNWPVQCSLFYSKSNYQKICNICKIIQPDVVITEMIRTATYYDAFKSDDVVSIANLDDLLSKRYRRQMGTSRSKANIVGAYSEKIPVFVNKVFKYQKIKNILLGYEAKHCEMWERNFYKTYDYSLFTSPVETNEINTYMKDNKALTLSVGIDYELFSRDINGLVKEPNTLSYVGNFKVAANCDTLRMICEEILPLVKSKYKFYVIGSCPDDIRKKYESNRIIFTGRVDDLAENIRKTQIFFSPISYGTGIKTKIIEAMAMGLPVITNDVGAEGIDGKSGIHFLIENEYSKLANQVDELLVNEQLMQEIGKNAQLFAYEYFRWEVVYKSFEKAGL
ncbi:glycosyltransferase family 4 protein [Lacrimispora sp.]|uniref:glycosyltransferase family 4 protein n=1 Tax=Lacrimispora sp. TaxID=2719234 RepID=UPI00289BC213|nr:glycosyltransferase family 4 protein [Lacrimispora sp.]